jgi:hypothetical protein
MQDQDNELVGATVLDDIFIEKGFADVANLLTKGPKAIFAANKQLEVDASIEKAKGLNLEELDDLLAEEESEENEDEGLDVQQKRDIAILQAFRMKRIQELQIQEGIRKNVTGIIEIDIEEFEEKVKTPSEKSNSIMIIYRQGDPQSDLLLQCMQVLSLKFRGLNWTKVQYSPLIKGFPVEDCPAVLCYSAGVVIGQFARLSSFAGMSTTSDIVEWELSKRGVLLTTLEQDPRGKFKLNIGARKPISKSNDSDDDDDW